MTHQLHKRFLNAPYIMPSGCYIWTDEVQPASNVMLLCIRGINPIVINPNVQCPKKLKETSTQRIHYQRHIFFTLLSPPLVYEVGVGLLVGGSATNDSVCVAFAVPFVL